MQHRDWYGKDVLDECNRLRKVLQPISDNFHGPLDRAESTNTLFPFVLLLGNHSSGKSSFINYILNRKVQQTGVAPTDDSFTIICPGEADMDKNGPAFVGDPDLGFSGLKSFGPVLVNHTQLKVRANIAVKDFMIVDSPGMIDSPVSRNTVDTVVGDNNEVLDRGYDFAGVCRWYAERADVILLFFDPDKPGTTGETLSILTKSLKGFDHKLHIILNKADQFRKIHDFARAYGSLCWNLSKVIARKDLPRIHTMCLPVHALPSKSPSPALASAADEHLSNNPSRSATPLPTNHHASLSVADDLAVIRQELQHSSPDRPVDHNNEQTLLVLHRSKSASKSFFDQGFLDLEEARTEVIREAFNAPKRRVDNEISRLYEDVVTLEMHCNVIQQVVARYNHRLWSARLWSLGTMVLSVAATIGVQYVCDYVAQRNIQWSLSGAAAVVNYFSFGYLARPSVPRNPSGADAVKTPDVPNTSSGKGIKATNTSALRVSRNSNASSTSNKTSGNVSTDPVDDMSLATEEITPNPDVIYQKIIVATGLTGLLTTTIVSVWKYVQLHNYLQQYAPSAAQEQAKRRNQWSIFNLSRSFTSHTQPSVSASTSGPEVVQTVSGVVEVDQQHPHFLAHHYSPRNRLVLEEILVDLHAKEYKKDDKFTVTLANQVLDHLCDHLTPAIIPTLTSVPKKNFEALHRIVSDDIANLRRRATPSFPALSPPPKMLTSIAVHQPSHLVESSSPSPAVPLRSWTPSDENLAAAGAVPSKPAETIDSDNRSLSSSAASVRETLASQSGYESDSSSDDADKKDLEL